MVKKTKSKARLDKFYKIAKEQGYRSRASFKLIQLNKKYNFLQNASVLIDLCAAPGGWLQVASKYMSDSSIIVGVDLDPIKPIKNCRTFQEDITTQKCYNTIRREIQHMKADAVICDGAPNVGSNWSKDAYSQIELCVYALKLATKFLRKGGIFVTKVFRSNDYHSLIWLFNKFFKKVEASKPEASRAHSAEIFVVCQDYIAPDIIDPKFFDPVYVFKDSESDILASLKNKEANSIKKVFEKRKRRLIDDDAPLTMFKKITLEDFVNVSNPYPVFIEYNAIDISNKETLKKYSELSKLPNDFEDMCKDIKLLNKKNVFSLIKWRAKLIQNKKKEEDKVEEVKEMEEQVDQAENDYKLLRKVDKMERKSKEKSMIKFVKNKLINNQAIGAEQQLEDLNSFDFLKHKDILGKGVIANVDEENEIYVDPDEARRVDKNKKLNSYNEVSDNIEYLYEQKRMVNKSDKKKDILGSILSKKKPKEETDAFTAKTEVREAVQFKEHDSNAMEIEELQEKSKFFDRDIFNVLKAQKVKEVAHEKEEQEVNNSVSSSDDEEKMNEEIEKDMNDYLEENAREELEDMNDDELAEILALSKKMMRKKKRRKIIDDSYNRYNYPEDPSELPKWFYEDERKHIGKMKEITKEDVAAEKERLKILKKRLPKKVLEAKMRQRKRLFNSIKKANQKAEAIFENDSIGGFSKAKQINNLYKSAVRKTKPKKKEVFVAKKFTSGAPRKKKGRKFVVVDKRMKKDLRAQKNKKIKKKR